MGLRETGCGHGRPSHGEPPLRSDESYYILRGTRGKALGRMKRRITANGLVHEAPVRELYRARPPRIAQTSIFLPNRRDTARRPAGAHGPRPGRLGWV